MSKKKAAAATENDNPDENIVKVGDQFDLMKSDPGLRHISVRAGWDAKSYDGKDMDMDVSLIFLNAQDQTIKDEDFVFYNQPEAYDGAVKHTGDSRDGAGAGDDEKVDIDLQSVPYDYIKILICVSIYRGAELDQNLGDVANGFIRVVNEADNKQILRYRLDEDLKGHEEQAVVAAVVERMGGQWLFKPLAEFVEGGLGGIASRHGLIIATQ